MPDQDGPPETELVDQRIEVGEEVVHRVRVERRVAHAVTAQVERDAAVTRFEVAQNRQHVGVQAGHAVQEHDRGFARTRLHVVQADTVTGDRWHRASLSHGSATARRFAGYGALGVSQSGRSPTSVHSAIRSVPCAVKCRPSALRIGK